MVITCGWILNVAGYVIRNIVGGYYMWLDIKCGWLCNKKYSQSIQVGESFSSKHYYLNIRDLRNKSTIVFDEMTIP